MIEIKENELYQEIELFVDGEKIGEAEINIKNKMLSRLSIFPPYQNKGYGTEVVRILSEEYGCDCLWVNADNTKAIHIYEKNGYKIVKPTMFLMQKEENKIETIKNPETADTEKHKEQLFDKLLNTKFKAWGDISLNDLHEMPVRNERDEGWNNCFDAFCEAISMLQGKNPETIFKENKDVCDSYHDGFCDILGRQLTAEEDAGCCHSCQATQKGCD